LKNIAIFAHDAGGSELLLELLKASLHVGSFRIFCVNNSPCSAIIKDKKLDSFETVIEPNEDFIYTKLDSFKPDLILYSTGWQNHYEYYFLSYAKKHKLISIAFLDNWSSYKERFGYPKKDWQENFPDFIAAHDRASEKLALSLGLKNIIVLKNYSLKKQLKEYRDLEIKQEDRLLFLSEPTAKVAKKRFGDENYWGFREEDVFRSVLEFSTCRDIVVRLHPSDKARVYKKLAPNIAISSNKLLEDIAQAKAIVGVDSSVLYLAYLLGKKVISYIPSKRRDFYVPLPANNQTRELDKIDIDLIKTHSEDNDIYGMDFALFVKGRL
jgi:ADP-heptose:LPS heptosyltransferase